MLFSFNLKLFCFLSCPRLGVTAFYEIFLDRKILAGVGGSVRSLSNFLIYFKIQAKVRWGGLKNWPGYFGMKVKWATLPAKD
jgi:hypothetical protein